MPFGENRAKTTGAPRTGEQNVSDFEAFYAAFMTQTRYLIKRITDLYDEAARARFADALPRACAYCAEKGLDVTGRRTAQFRHRQGVTFATTVDSCCPISTRSMTRKICDFKTLIAALDQLEGLEGGDREKQRQVRQGTREADALACRFMSDCPWVEYKTRRRARSAAACSAELLIGWVMCCPPAPTGVKTGSSSPTPSAPSTAPTSTDRLQTPTPSARHSAAKGRTATSASGSTACPTGRAIPSRCRPR